jgi:hypothetical protein
LLDGASWLKRSDDGFLTKPTNLENLCKCCVFNITSEWNTTEKNHLKRKEITTVFCTTIFSKGSPQVALKRAAHKYVRGGTQK